MKFIDEITKKYEKELPPINENNELDQSTINWKNYNYP